ncbi:MAG: rRNA maturation RNase YbeY, partial [Puniceicoccales bacterium]|nr:rRNA maturation RNase YbeY [Puniceicoccales bacterium]
MTISVVEDLRAIEVCNACRRIVISAEDVRNLFWALDRNGQFYLAEGDLSVAFVPNEKIRAIHGEFLGDHSLTDVISFPGDPELNFAGEIVVCPLYAMEQSKFYNTTLCDEIKLYLVHGYLHLCGLKDKSEEEAQKMRSGEKYCLDFLKNFPLQVSPMGLRLTRGAPPPWTPRKESETP